LLHRERRLSTQKQSPTGGVEENAGPGAQCVGGGAVLRFTCRFGSWKHHTRQLDPPVGLTPSTRARSTESNGKRRIGRYRLFTTFISSLPSWTCTALDRVPRHPATPRRWAELMPPFIKKTRTPGQARVQRAKPASRQWVIGTLERRRGVLIIAVLLHGLDKELN
jgi:hypothetical protein